MSDVQTLMRNANPVPDAATEFGPDDLDALLLLTRSRSTDMDAKELTRAVEKDSKNRRSSWYVAAAAFGLVVLLVGSVVLLNRSSDPEIPPGTTPSTTTSLAPTTTTAPSTSTTTAAPAIDPAALAFMDGFVAELNAGDYQAAADRVIAAEQFVGEPALPQNTTQDARFRAKYHMWTELLSAVTVSDCTTNSSGFTRCTLTRTSEREPALADEPERWTIRLRIADGQLTYFEQAANGFEPWWQAISDIEDWLISTDNDVYMAAFFSPTDGVLAADLREEYMQLWIDAGRP